ncbi:7TM diverse intracellular signaling domain-containing protein [Bacillus tianshenii]|nr:7TM diverse intracellular signaling domain-containing protein [Bacillus tianshenii]
MLVILFSFLIVASSVDAEELVETHPLGKEYEFFRDETGEVTIEEILAGELDGQFESSESVYPYFGYTTDVVWLKLERGVIGEAFDNMNFLEFVDKLEFIEVYFVKDDGSYEMQKSGLVNMDQRTLHLRSFLYEFEPKNLQAIYFKLSGDELPVSVNTNLYSTNGLIESVKEYKYLSGIFYGFMISLALYNLFLYFSLRERAYLYYVLYIIAFILTQASMNSLDVEYLGEVLPVWFMADSLDYAALLLCVTMTVFGRAFLETKKLLPYMDRLLLFFLFISAGTFLLFAIIPDHLTNVAVPLFVLIVPILLWVAAIRVMLKGKRMARFYVLGWTILLSSLIVQALSYLSVIPFQTMYFDVIPQVAACLEALFLSFALADKINILKKQREEAQRLYTEKLEEADRMKDEFLFRTSHELKTPLHGIINISQSLLEDTKHEKELEKKMLLIKSTGYRMTNMVNDILDLAKIKEGRLSVQIAPVDLYSVTANVFEMFRFIAEGKSIQLVNQIDESHRFVLADENRLLQVYYNLVNNSLKNTNAGSITISSYVKDEYVHVTVEDTGKGIPLQFQEKIFLAYEQALPKDELGSGGVGLGLSISRQLVQIMDGRLYLDWSKENEGSRFVFTLPFVGEKEEHGKYEVQQQQVAPTTDEEVPVQETSFPKGSREVLIVDDEVLNAEILRNILEKEGYKTTVVFSGEEALEYVKHSKPHLILLDVMLPGMSGYDVSKQMRKEYSLIEVPILFITVRNSIEDINASFLNGGNDYITKPFEADEIRARVRTLFTITELAEEATRNELAYLQSQIKPHFLYNSLNTIMYFCYRDSERAAELLAVFTEYLRYIFQKNISEEYVTIMKELEFVQAYVTLQKARFKERLQFEINADVHLLQYEIPILTIQPLVENAINHGVMKKVEGGAVSINITESLDEIIITVHDNGVGMPAEIREALFSNKQSGIGLKNIHKRVMKLTRKGLTINSAKNAGTTVSFSIRKRLK